MARARNHEIWPQTTAFGIDRITFRQAQLVYVFKLQRPEAKEIFEIVNIVKFASNDSDLNQCLFNQRKFNITFVSLLVNLPAGNQ